jgi:hypothetical protein
MNFGRKDYDDMFDDMREDKVIDVDEPVFLFRAQDAFAHYAVQVYIDMLEAAGFRAQAKMARNHLGHMRDWHKKKIPDIPHIR